MVTYSRSIRIPPKTKRKQGTIRANTTANFNGNAADAIEALFPNGFQWCHDCIPLSVPAVCASSQRCKLASGIMYRRPSLTAGKSARWVSCRSVGRETPSISAASAALRASRFSGTTHHLRRQMVDNRNDLPSLFVGQFVAEQPGKRTLVDAESVRDLPKADPVVAGVIADECVDLDI